MPVLRSRVVSPTDDVNRNGTSNGARRRARSRRAVSGEDDRPRGFEPDRMRRLWSDIDSARDNLGLGPEAAESAAPWSVAGVVGYVGELAIEAVDTVIGWTRVLPDPRRVIGAALPCVRRVPIVGGFFE